MLVVSLTTIPPRLDTLQAVIDSINDQTIVPDRIELNIPLEYRRKNLGAIRRTALPKGCDIYFVDFDYGPATKVLPTVERYKNQDVKIVFCDDDRIYEKNWLKRLTELSAANPKCCVAENGMNANRRLKTIFWRQKPFLYRLLRAFSFGLFKPTKLRNNEKINIVEGFGGCLVKPNFFPLSVFSIPEHMRLVDDIWLSGNIALQKISVVLTQRTSQQGSRAVQHNRDTEHDRYALKQLQSDGEKRLELDKNAIEWFRTKHGIWID